MESFICKACGSSNVRLSASLPVHLIRKALKSSKRRCLDCRYKWREPGQRRTPYQLAVLLGGACLSLAIIVQWREIMSLRTGPRTGFRQNPRAPEPSLSGRSGQEYPLENADDLDAEYGAGKEQTMPGQHPFPKDWGIPPAETWAAAGQPEKKGFFSNYSKLLDIALKMLQGRSKKEIIRELDTADKKTLWNKYGGYFSSKEEAKKAYDEYKSKKSSGQINAEPRGQEP